MRNEKVIFFHKRDRAVRKKNNISYNEMDSAVLERASSSFCAGETSFHHVRKNLGSSFRRGVSSILSFVVLFTLIVTAIAIFLNSSKVTVDSANTNIRIIDAEGVMNIFDNRFRELASEGNGSARLVEITTQGDFRVSGDEDVVQFETDATGFDQFSRLLRGNILFIGGNDVNCRRADVTGDGVLDLFMENTYINATLRYTAGPRSAGTTAPARG